MAGPNEEDLKAQMASLSAEMTATFTGRIDELNDFRGVITNRVD